MKWFICFCAMLVAGCASNPNGATTATDPSRAYLAPLALQQRQTYPQTVTGKFVSLVDFESDPAAADPVSFFSVAPAGAGQIAQVLDVTRTGAAAMKATLDSGATLVFRSPVVHDLRPYTLFSVSVHSDRVRDDLQLTLTGPAGAWQSRRRLLRGGWNTVLIDLNDLTRRQGAKLSHFDTLGIRFADATEAVTCHLDDIMLIDNRRRIAGTPDRVAVIANGLNYTLRLPGWGDPIYLKPGADGLWRLGRAQPTVQLTGPTHPEAATGEDIAIMGRRRLGVVELLEVNRLRVRIRNTWYFPPQAGQWIDMDVRQIRWDYTFYADGRWVTSMLLNNAGGEDITTLRLTAPTPVAFADGRIGRQWELRGFDGVATRCTMLSGSPDDIGDLQRANYARPAPMTLRLGRPTPAAAENDLDGFDETRGCYVARAIGGNCRIELTPRPKLYRPVVHIRGPWTGQVTANCDGLPLKPVVKLPDGVLVVVPATLTRPAVIEFTGPVDLLDE